MAAATPGSGSSASRRPAASTARATRSGGTAASCSGPHARGAGIAGWLLRRAAARGRGAPPRPRHRRPRAGHHRHLRPGRAERSRGPPDRVGVGPLRPERSLHRGPGCSTPRPPPTWSSAGSRDGTPSRSGRSGYGSGGRRRPSSPPTMLPALPAHGDLAAGGLTRSPRQTSSTIKVWMGLPRWRFRTPMWTLIAGGTRGRTCATLTAGARSG